MSNNSNSGGIGVLGTLTLIFVVLKLVGVIKWSWWWVLAPSWITFAIIGVALLVRLIAVLGVRSATR